MLQSYYVVSTSSVKIVFLNGEYDDFTSLSFFRILPVSSLLCRPQEDQWIDLTGKRHSNLNS